MIQILKILCIKSGDYVIRWKSLYKQWHAGSKSLRVRSMSLVPLFQSRLCIPFFNSLDFWTPVSQEFPFPRENSPPSWGIIVPISYSPRDGSWGIPFLGEFPFCRFPSRFQKNWRLYFLSRYVPHGRKRINIQHTLEQLLKRVPLNS